MPDRIDQPRAELVPVGAEVRHLPVRVVSPPRAIDRPPSVTLSPPVVAATGGMVAGVATMVLVRLLRRGSTRSRRRRAGRPAEVAVTRSFLVDVHLLRR
jgi:hypothetical protein